MTKILNARFLKKLVLLAVVQLSPAEAMYIEEDALSPQLLAARIGGLRKNVKQAEESFSKIAMRMEIADILDVGFTSEEKAQLRQANPQEEKWFAEAQRNCKIAAYKLEAVKTELRHAEAEAEKRAAPFSWASKNWPSLGS